MNSKGISPMIAVVLLVAFTVAVGGILSLWLTGYATTTTESVESSTSNQTKCAGTYPKIETVSSSAVLLTNPGTEDISSVSCYMSDGTPIGTLEGALTPGELDSLSGDDGFGGVGSNTSILCTGTCGNIGVSSECKSGQTCWP